eukprot:171103-Prorocentrum_minimum.AAC.5
MDTLGQFTHSGVFVYWRGELVLLAIGWIVRGSERYYRRFRRRAHSVGDVGEVLDRGGGGRRRGEWLAGAAARLRAICLPDTLSQGGAEEGGKGVSGAEEAEASGRLRCLEEVLKLEEAEEERAAAAEAEEAIRSEGSGGRAESDR